LKKDHGIIKGYVAPKKIMKGSIMNLSSTSGGGRGRDDGSIIGEVINHGKKKYWKRGGEFVFSLRKKDFLKKKADSAALVENYHYHCTLKKGECKIILIMSLILFDCKKKNPSLRSNVGRIVV
jgi:hypothetical protein